MTANIFQQLGLPKQPVILAPLAGVSDHPFRRLCAQQGADLTYVEMLSATALIYNSKRTFEMLARHQDESILGVQVTARTPAEMYEAVRKLDEYPFETLDINMGCPVRKVVQSGCGSAILKDPKRVYETTAEAVRATKKPVSVKIRLGWDHESLNFIEVAKAAEAAGAAWLTMHGRTRSDTYAVGVDLDKIAELKQALSIPVLGNGNLFSLEDDALMKLHTQCDGVMVSRGALGNPWVFRDIKEGVRRPLSIDEWWSGVNSHIQWQKAEYGDNVKAVITMRKHLLWYLKGWPLSKVFREQIVSLEHFSQVEEKFQEFIASVKASGVVYRSFHPVSENEPSKFLMGLRTSQAPEEGLSSWDPKYDMSREFDTGADFQ